MPNRLSVGIETNCTAPLRLEQASLRLYKLLGVDSMMLPDHYLGFIPRSLWSPENTPAAKMIPSSDAFFDPFVLMGMMASRFRNVRIGTGVTEPFRRHPVTLAQAFVTLDHMTGGRAILGIGNGERENTEPYGLPFKKRVGRLEEALEIIRLMWASGGEPVDFDGSIWKLKRALFATPLYNGKAPDIWIASHAPRMLGLTGRYADGWYPTKKMSPQEYGECLQRIRAAGTEAGRDMSSFEPALQIQLVLGPNRTAALEQVARVPATAAMALLMPGQVWAKHGLHHPLGESFEGFPDFVPEEITAEQIATARKHLTPELLNDGVFAGNVDEVVEELRPLAAAGMRHVVIWNIGPLATGASPGGMFQLARLIRKLRKIEI
jgi:phthiodiolone/phenolphthiodiolone dimycocerosates ketoreductase